MGADPQWPRILQAAALLAACLVPSLEAQSVGSTLARGGKCVNIPRDAVERLRQAGWKVVGCQGDTVTPAPPTSPFPWPTPSPWSPPPSPSLSPPPPPPPPPPPSPWPTPSPTPPPSTSPSPAPSPGPSVPTATTTPASPGPSVPTASTTTTSPKPSVSTTTATTTSTAPVNVSALTVQASLVLNGSAADVIQDQNFSAALCDSVASVLGVPSTSVKVLNIASGSIIVLLGITPTAGGPPVSQVLQSVRSLGSVPRSFLGKSLLSIGSVGFQTGSRMLMTFQNGVANYQGTVSATITNQNSATYNDFRGNTAVGGFCNVGINSANETWKCLMRFDNLWLPEGAVVVNASLRLWQTSWQCEGYISGRFLKGPFNASDATILGWKRFGPGVNSTWSSPGVGEGDLESAVSNFTIPCNAGGTSMVVVPLPRDLVQRWIQFPALSYGLVLIPKLLPGKTAWYQFYGGDMTEMDMRPQVFIEYTRAAFDNALGVPDTVANLTLSVASATSLLVAWNPPLSFPGIEAPTVYEVAYSTSRSGPWTYANTTSTQYTIAGLPTNSLWWVQVRAYNSVGPSKSLATTPLFAVPAAPPGMPTSLQVEVQSATAFMVNWQPPTFDGGSPILGYLVQFGPDGSVQVPATARSYLVSNVPANLPASQTVLVRITAFTAVGAGQVAQTSVKPAVRTPGPPQNVIAFAADATTVQVEWDQPLFDGGQAVSGYVVEASNTSNFATIVATATLSPPTPGLRHFPLKVGSLVTGRSYYFRVTAANRLGNSAPAFAAGAAAPRGLTTATATFQNGRGGYTSGRELSISTQYIADWNYYNGQSYGLPYTPYNTIGLGTTVADANTELWRSLLRFDNLNTKVPTNASVLKATLGVYLICWVAPPVTMQGFYLNASWEWNQTKSNSKGRPTGWAFRQGELQWTAPGALGDVYNGTSFYLTTASNGYTYREVPLDAGIVQKWVANPNQNYGVVIAMNTVGKSCQITSSNNPDLSSLAPILTITYQVATDGGAPLPVPTPQLGVTPAQGRQLFVDPVRGNDSDPGSEALPARTLQYALYMATPYDIILLRGGVHVGGVSVSRNDITMASAPGEWAIIATRIDEPATSSTLLVRESAARFHLANLELVGGYYYALNTFTSFENFNIGPDREMYGYGPPDMLVEDCILHDSGSSVIKLKEATTRAVFRRNRIFGAGRRMRTYGHGFEMVNVWGATIEDNHIYDLPGAGAKMSGGCKDIIFQRNYVEKAYLGGAMLGFYEATEYFSWITNRAYFECIRCQAVSNIIVAVEGVGVGLYAANSSVVAHNTMFGVAQDLMAGVTINAVQHWENGTAAGQPIRQTLNPLIFNNIMVKSKESIKSMIVQIRQLTSVVDGSRWDGLQGSLNASGNVYSWLASQAGPVFTWGIGAMFEDELLTAPFVGNLSSWKNFTKSDASSVEANPVLTSDYRLDTCSPAVGLGTQLPIVAADYDGQPYVNATVDSGATQLSTPLALRKPYPPLPNLAARTPYSGPVPPVEYLTWWPFDIMRKRSCITYYVNGSAPSSGNGSLATPFNTIAAAMAVVWPCDTIRVRNGTYREAVRFQMPNVTLEAYPGESVNIVVPKNDPSVANAVFFADSGSGNFGGSGQNTLRRLDIQGGYYYVLMFNQAGGGTSNTFWNWYRRQVGDTSPAVTLVEDCRLHESGTSVVKLSPEANDIVFRRVEIYQLGALQAAWNESIGNGIDNRNGNNMVVEDSYIHDVSGCGILLGGGARNCVVQRTLISNVGGIGIMVGSYNTEAMWMRPQSNPELYQSIGAVIRNNVVVNAAGAGVGLYSAKDALVIHNTFADVARTMHAAVLFNIAPNYEWPSRQILPRCVNVTLLANIWRQPWDAVGYMLENRVWTSSTPPIPAFVPPADTCASVQNATVAASKPPDTVAKNSGPGGKCPVFPPSHSMNVDISAFPVHPRSDTLLASLRKKNLHPDFGGYVPTPYGNTLAGIAVNYVNKTTPFVRVDFNMYPDESDPGPYPFPPNALIEGTPPGCPMNVCNGDRHIIAVDTDNCMVYETWKSEPNGTGYSAANGAIFNLTTAALRPLGWTSADAAGLSIYAGLVRYDEVLAGAVNHAVRMTFAFTRKSYILPATHYASYDTSPELLGMGYRLRLKSSYNCAALATQARVVCVGLQKYGAIVADNGADWYITGEADSRWNTAELADVAKIPASAMEVVYTGEDCLTSDCRVNPPAPSPETGSALRNLTDFAMDYNIYYRQAGDYTVAKAEFVDRDPVHWWRDQLTAIDGWANHSGVDHSSVIGDPRLTAGLAPKNDSIALLLAPYTVHGALDFYGNQRVAVGGFVDSGAIAYNALPRAPRVAGGLYPPDLETLFGDPCGNMAPLTQIYVRKNGSDSSCNGTSTSPFATIQVALRRCSSPCTVYVGTGFYNGPIVMGKDNVTIMPEAGARVVIRVTPLIDAGDVISIRASGCKLKNLEILGSSTFGVSINGPNAEVVNCTVHGAGQALVNLLSPAAAGAVIQNCSFRNSGQRQPRQGDGVRIVGAQNVKVIGNTFIMIKSTAVHIRNGARTVLVAWNTIAGARRGVSVGNDNGNLPQIIGWDYSLIDDTACPWYDSTNNPSCYEVQNVRVIGNIIAAITGPGVYVVGSDTVTIAGNTLYRTGSVQLGALTFSAMQHWMRTSSPVVANRNLLVQNNIVVMRGESRRPAVHLLHATDWTNNAKVGALDKATSTFTKNLYFQEAAPSTLLYPAIYYTSGSGATSAAGLFFKDSLTNTDQTLSAWQGAGLETGSRVADPLLSTNLVPQTGSPALAAGAAAVSSEEGVDLYGFTRGSTPDLGAVEVTARSGGAVPPLLVPLDVVQLPIVSPQSCPTRSPNLCNGTKCWHAWQGRAAPANLDMLALNARCLNGGSMFPGKSWGRDISNDPVDRMSDDYVASIGGGANLHADGGTLYLGNPSGIPFMVINDVSAYTALRGSFDYASESDAGPYAIPEDSPVEGGDCENNGDRHVLVVDQNNCKVYEIYRFALLDPEYRAWLGVGFTGESGAIFDLRSTAYRPLGWTSSDAAGLSVFAGLVHYHAVMNNTLNYPIRFTVKVSQMAYFYPPATHFASNQRSPTLPPMGLRIRLKSWFNCTATFPTQPEARTICLALQKYGMINADNGGNWYLTCAADPRWNDPNLFNINKISASALEAVSTGARLCTTSDCS